MIAIQEHIGTTVIEPPRNGGFGMRVYVLALVALTAATALSSCDNAIETAYNEQIVVSAFLYANAPIDSVVLHRTTPFGAYYDDLDYAVDSATVIVTVDGVPHTLLPAKLKGRYSLPASDLIVQAGKTYQLSITAPNNQTGGKHSISAVTTVPMPIHLSPLADSVRGRTFVLDTNNLASFVFVVTAGPVESPERRYLLSVTALDTNYGRIRPPRGLDSVLPIRYSLVATGPAIAVTSRFVNWYGPNLITFYAIDTNWTDYQRQIITQGGTNYQASLNHIAGGMGVFASASRDTVSLFVKPKQ
ncbi:MAG: DUF4249 family protein [Bacteroidota bacterium]|nr:DUF4249 family protein [Bacteroidota bacterium]MDP4233864.1 DUF4249 family protein [Bacteroidota bacterium]MDP4243537.1 DUF4249 family protein [Bacteroidota bacterium]MDP4288924.1 DUF4249 family protein [Bacteroidota bacterium]